MTNPNRVILENTLKFSFHLILCVVNIYGEEHETIYKKSRKKFLQEIGTDNCSVKLVDSYPPKDMAFNIIYIKKDGKTAWLKVKEGGSVDNFMD